MRQASIDYITIGDVLARTIFSSDGQVLLGRGVVLTAGFISKLKQLGISALYIEDPRLADVKVEDMVGEETRRAAMQGLKEAIDVVRSGKSFDGTKIKASITSIVEELMADQDILVNLADIRSQENWLMSHSVSVCVLSTILGVAYGLDRFKLHDLAVGAILHDVGLASVPKEVLAKGEGNPTPQEKEIYEKHPEMGFAILRKNPDLNLTSAHVAFQHHERVDGSGYPRGLTGEDIHVFARITAIVDLYDKLINGGFGRQPIMPHEACEHLMGLAGCHLDFELVRVFLKNVATYPTGISVRLSTGEIGVVVDQNRSIPMRPVVRVLQEKFRFVEPKEYNLIKDTTVFIKDVLR